MLLERHAYPPGVPCWIDTNQPDPVAAAQFYGDLFGWELTDRMPADAPGHYFMATLDGVEVAGIGSADDGSAAWNTYVAVSSADEAAAKARRAGATLLLEPSDVVDAGRTAILRDPSGAELSLWEPRRHQGAGRVNEPSTWNWSNLETPDIETAKAFYGDLFGWEFDDVAFGDGESVMVRRPGYAEVLAEHDPEIRRRHAEAGAPGGFSDAVGWMMPGESPPQWSVTFAVDDTDAIAARAAQLGGEVVAEPVDIGPVRLAVLRDPQGARFTISHYDPR